MRRGGGWDGVGGYGGGGGGSARLVSWGWVRGWVGNGKVVASGGVRAVQLQGVRRGAEGHGQATNIPERSENRP